MLLKHMTMYPIYLTKPISDHMKPLKSNTMNMKKISIIVDSILAAAVIALFVLYFLDKQPPLDVRFS